MQAPRLTRGVLCFTPNAKRKRVTILIPPITDDRSRADKFAGQRSQYLTNRKRILASQDVCGICGKPVDKSLKYPHPMSATVDHIIPLDRGGHPSDLANLQLAHFCCNRQKSNRLMENAPAAAVPKVVSNRLLPLTFDWKTI